MVTKAAFGGLTIDVGAVQFDSQPFESRKDPSDDLFKGSATIQGSTVGTVDDGDDAAVVVKGQQAIGV